MQSGDDLDAFMRQCRESRLATAATLDRASSMLPPDAATRSAIDAYRQSALRDDFPSMAAHLTQALDRLETCAQARPTTRDFWLALQDLAVMDALYDRALVYRDRADKA